MIAAPASGPAVEIDRISKRYGRTLALDDVTFEVPRGDVFALLGPNGAGKTTLLHILCTILRPDSGSARIGGVDVMKDPLGARRSLAPKPLPDSSQDVGAVMLTRETFLRTNLDQAITALTADGTIEGILQGFGFPATPVR